VTPHSAAPQGGPDVIEMTPQVDYPAPGIMLRSSTLILGGTSGALLPLWVMGCVQTSDLRDPNRQRGGGDARCEKEADDGEPAVLYRIHGASFVG